MRVEPSALDQLLHPMLDPKAKPTPIATGLPASPGAASGEIVFSADDAEAAAQGRPQDDPGSRRNLARGHPRHARRRRHPDHARRHDLARGGRRARHGQALRLRRGLDPHRLREGDDDRGRRHAEEGRHPHHRRRGRRGDGGRRADDQAGAHRRIRHADGLGRRGAPHEGARQRRDAGRRAHRALVRRRGHRPLPHRAHVLRGRPDRRDARDDPGRDRGGPARGARQASADAAARTSPSCSRS